MVKQNRKKSESITEDDSSIEVYSSSEGDQEDKQIAA